MKYIIVTIGLGLLQLLTLNLFYSCNEEKQNLNRPDSYVVTFNEKEQKIIKVEAKLEVEDSLLYMSNNGPIPERWPQYIHNLKALDKNGKQIVLEERDSTAWILKDVKKGESVQLNYEMVLEHDEIPWPGGIDGVAYKKECGVMATGRSLFIMNGADKNNIQVKFEKPSNWKVAAPWSIKNSSKNIYEVTNLEKLQESIIFAGTHEEMLLERNGFTLQFVLGGSSILENKAQYNSIATKVLDYYIKLMGGIPKPVSGSKLTKVLVLINESEQLDGEVIGDHISLLINPNADAQSQMIGWFMFAHEFFHLWNGKTIRFNDTKSDWFKEGITNYYTLKALHQIGFADEEVVKMILNNLFYQKYINDTGLGKIAPSDAASGFDKDNHWGLIYGGGLFAGMCMDMEIRNNSQNQKSMDDLLRYFYNHIGGTDSTISNVEILRKTKELSGTDFSNFANSCIFGTDKVPLPAYLKYAGVNVDTSGTQLKLTHQTNKSELEKELWLGFLGKMKN